MSQVAKATPARMPTQLIKINALRLRDMGNLQQRDETLGIA